MARAEIEAGTKKKAEAVMLKKEGMQAHPHPRLQRTNREHHRMAQEPHTGREELSRESSRLQRETARALLTLNSLPWTLFIHSTAENEQHFPPHSSATQTQTIDTHTWARPNRHPKHTETCSSAFSEPQWDSLQQTIELLQTSHLHYNGLHIHIKTTAFIIYLGPFLCFAYKLTTRLT